jgi:hypothetical protein
MRSCTSRGGSRRLDDDNGRQHTTTPAGVDHADRPRDCRDLQIWGRATRVGADARNFERHRWQIVVTAMTAEPLCWCRRCLYEAVDRLTLLSDARIDRLEARLARIERAIIRIEERLAVTLPYLAPKAELGDKPSWHYNWGVRAAMTATLGNYRRDLSSRDGLMLPRFERLSRSSL